MNYQANVKAGICGRCAGPRDASRFKQCEKCNAKHRGQKQKGPVINYTFLVCCAGFGRHRAACKAWGK